MQYDTFLFGPIEVRDDRVIEFPDALPGFEHCRNFTLVHRQGTDDPASFTLQSLDDPAVAFHIADPASYGCHYELTLSDAERELLRGDDPAEIAVMLLVHRDQPAAPISANIRAPLLINTRTRQAMQKVIRQLAPRVTLAELSQSLD